MEFEMDEETLRKAEEIAKKKKQPKVDKKGGIFDSANYWLSKKKNESDSSDREKDDKK
jgi:hypothetical protein